MAFWNKKKKDKESGEDEAKEEGSEHEEKETGGEEEKAVGGDGEKAGDEEGKEGEEGEGHKKKKKKKLIIIAAACVVMLGVVAGAGAYFMGFIGHPKQEEQKIEAKGEPGAPVFYDLPQMLVNLNTGSKTPSFIKVTVTLELSSQEDLKSTQANMPRLLDSYNGFLREMKASDLYGSAGMDRLREEMILRANTSLAPVKVKDVLFKEILVQ